MTKEDNVRLIEQIAEMHTTSLDIEKFETLFADDVALEVVARGRDEMKELFERTWAVAPRFRDDVAVLVANGNRGGAEWVLSGKHLGDFPGLPASGKSVSVRVGAIMWFSNGRISYWNDYWSLLTFKEQTGLA